MRNNFDTISTEPPFANTRVVRLWTLIGRFIMRYAYVENFVYQVSKIETGLPDAIANALMNGDRMSDTVGNIKRIYTAKGIAEIPEPLNRALQKVGELTTFRNELMHNGLSIGPESNLISTIIKAVSADNIINVKVNEDSFNQIDADLETIEAALLLHLMIISKDSRAEPSLLHKERAFRPWQYKHPERSGRTQSKRESKARQESSDKPRRTRQKASRP